MKHAKRLAIVLTAVLALAACGASEGGTPGEVTTTTEAPATRSRTVTGRDAAAAGLQRGLTALAARGVVGTLAEPATLRHWDGAREGSPGWCSSYPAALS
jgi:hypothetical protein